nr:MAG TPA: hypothetical protein [Caudoviricetes sp.]
MQIVNLQAYRYNPHQNGKRYNPMENPFKAF